MIRWVKDLNFSRKDTNFVVRSENLLAIRERVREGAVFPGASRPDPSRHGSVESLRKLSLMDGHGQSSAMQQLFISEQFPLRAIHSLALRSIFLHHRHDLVTHPFFQIKTHKAWIQINSGMFSRESQTSFALDGINQSIALLLDFQRERERERE